MPKIRKNRVYGVILPILPEFCYRSATNLLQTTEKGASYTFHYQYAKVNSLHFCISKARRYKKSRLPFQVNGLTSGGALSTALEPEFIPDTAADSKHLAAHGESPQSCFHR